MRSKESVRQEASGADATTTNQRMELEAAAEGLEALTELAMPADLRQAIRGQGLNEWMDGWLVGKPSRKPVANRRPVATLASATRTASLTAEWTRGHAGNTHNERCDQLAVAAIEQLRSWRT